MDQATKMESFLKGKYNAMRYGDVFQNWDQLVRLARVTDSDEADPTTRMKNVLSHALITLWTVLSLFRLSLPVIWTTDIDYIMGQTMNNTGNVSKLIMSMGSAYLVQWSLYRLVCIRLILNGDMIFMQTLKSMVSGHEADGPRTSKDVRIQASEVRDQKIRLARLIHSATAISSFPMALCAYGVVTGYLWRNIQTSQTTFQICCWVFWYVQDLILSTAFAVDFLIYPSMWFVVALNYRMDIMSFTAKIQQLAGMKGMGVRRKRPLPLFREIREDYLRLAREAIRVNRMSAPILFALVLCTTPIACISLFVAAYSDNWVIEIMFPLIGALCFLFASFLLAIAADITSKNEKVHEVLCSAAARQSFASLLSVQQRRFLLLMMEHSSSETNSFAMMTIDGQKYTMESFVSFLIETGLQYTLLFTFNRGTAFQ